MGSQILKSDDFNLDYEDFPHKRIIRIEGVNYSYEILKAWGNDGLPIGAITKIISRDDGTVEFERLYDLEQKNS